MKLNKIATTAVVIASVSLTALLTNTANAQTSNATATNPVVVYFTQPVKNGRYHKPYVSIWIESTDRKAVDTLALWYNKNDDQRYLRTLKSWWSKMGNNQSKSQIDGYSGATRVPKRHVIKWDGKDKNGRKVANGTYWLNIEVAREDGGREIMRKKITLGNTGSLTAKGQSEIGDVQIHWK